MPPVLPTHARWIWCNNSPQEPNQYGLFRKTVTVPAGAGPVTLLACADLRYWVYVNGHRVGFGPGRYNPLHPLYDIHDITALVKPGDNLIAFKVHSRGDSSICTSYATLRGALIAAITWDGGSVCSDATWQTTADQAYHRDAPPMSCAHQSFTECFDARLAQPRWACPDFRATSWHDAIELSDEAIVPWGTLQPQPIAALTLDPRRPTRIIDRGQTLVGDDYDVQDLPRVAEMMEKSQRLPGTSGGTSGGGGHLFPLSLDAPDDQGNAAYAVLDFVENSAGYLCLELEGTPGTIVDMGYGEAMCNGTVNCCAQGLRYNDRIILGKGRLTHQLMCPKCLQFLLIEVRNGSAVIHDVMQEVSTYPVRWDGGFYTPDDECLERVWRLGAHTVQICMEDIYLDTPRRERAGWLGDMVPEAVTAYYAFGEYTVARHSLDLFMSSQQPEGWISGRYPTTQVTNMPSWSASYNMALADYVRFSGDCDFAKEMWPGIQKLTAWFETQRCDDDLLIVHPATVEEGRKQGHGYFLVDWAPMLRDGAISAMNMLYYRYLRDGATLAGLIGRDEEAAELNVLAQRTRKAIQEKLFDDTRGFFVNCLHEGKLSGQAGCPENLLALLWDIATSDQARRIESFMMPDDTPLPLWVNPNPKNWVALGNGSILWEGEGLVPMGSPFFAYYGISAMFEIGRTQLALNCIRKYYGDLIASGASTVWEEWAGNSSRSHGWGAGPTVMMGRFILGVEPVDPGFDRFTVYPSFGDLTQAHGRVPTPHGTIQVAWERTDGSDKLVVVVPEGTTAEVGLPVQGEQSRLMCDSIESQPTLTSLRRGQYAMLPLGPGRHQLEYVHR